MASSSNMFNGELFVHQSGVPDFNGELSVTLDDSIKAQRIPLSREFYGRLFLDNLLAPAGIVVRALNPFGDDYSDNRLNWTTVTDGINTWYQIYVLGSQSNSIVQNQSFEDLGETSSGLEFWEKEGSGTVEQIQERVTTFSGAFQVKITRQGEDTYIRQSVNIGSGDLELKPSTTYGVSVWIQSTQGCVGIISVVGDVSDVDTQSSNSGILTKIRTFFTTSASGSVEFQLRAQSINGTCVFDRLNVVRRSLFGFDEGENVTLTFNGKEGFDANESTVTLEFFQPEGLTTTGSTSQDLYIFAPVSSASPAGGVFENRENITLFTSDLGESVDIHYTTDGSTPTANSPSVPNGGIVQLPREGDILLQFFAIDSVGTQEQTINKEVYTVLPAAVEASLPPGIHGSSQTVIFRFKGNRQGTIFYTTDGTIPTESSLKFFNSGTVELTVEQDVTYTFFGVDIFGNDTRLIESGDPTEIQSSGKFYQRVRYIIDKTNLALTSVIIDDNAEKTNSNFVEVKTIFTEAKTPTRIQMIEVVDAGIIAKDPADLTAKEIVDIFVEVPVAVYESSKNFEISGDSGIKYVYVRLVTGEDETSNVLRDSIIADFDIPTFTIEQVTATTTKSSVVLTGTKTANSRIVLNDIAITDFTPATIWSSSVLLELGDNTLTLLAETEVGNKSVSQQVEIVVTIPKGVTLATTPVDQSGNWIIPFVLLDDSDGTHNFKINVTGFDVIILDPSESFISGGQVLTVVGTAKPNTIVTLSVEKLG